MSKLCFSKLFELSKQAKKNKDYELEKTYLEQALSIAPQNKKLINAFIRNLRKTGNHVELKRWLQTLYKMNPNGKILFELMNLEQSEGNSSKVVEILLENERIDPHSKKIKKRIQRISERENITISPNALFILTAEEEELIRSVREIIYSDEEFSEKYNKIVNLVAGLSEEIIVSLMAELYLSDSFTTTAHNLVKKFRKGLLPEKDAKRIRLANKLLELVLNKRTEKFNWDDFWRNNVTILPAKSESPKVLVKNNLENKKS